MTTNLQLDMPDIIITGCALEAGAAVLSLDKAFCRNSGATRDVGVLKPSNFWQIPLVQLLKMPPAISRESALGAA